MRKILIRIVLGLAVVALIAGGGFYFWLQSMLPAKEERVAYRNDLIIASIDTQLKDINLEQVKSKRSLMEQKPLEDIQKALKEGQITHEELVAYYLLNIKEIDQSPEGNNAISEINPKAIEEARKYDADTSHTGNLKGIPILLKENINTNDMPTSSGSYALKDFIPSSDAPAVESLKANGAIILGKTNLSEMSHWMSKRNPSGYSSKKGQTTNPFNPLVISPLGSSSGSAVAMATDLATLTLGTETVGSIVAPSSINSVVGYKPTRGAISGEGVIPITLSLDTVGPIAKNVKDAVATYNGATSKTINIAFDTNAIKGKKIGILKSDAEFDKMLKEKLVALGAEVIELEIDTTAINLPFVLVNDFEKDLNAYLETYNAPIKSLKELVAFNKQDEQARMRYGQTHLEDSLNPKRDDNKVKEIITLAQTTLNKAIDEHQLDAMVSKNNEGVTLSAGAGAPEISVPFGMLKEEPVGATFFGKLNDDANILNIAYSFEQLTNLRQIPNK